MLKAYKFRLYPTVEQSVLLEKHFGACRFIYNHFLALSKKDKVLKKSDMQKAIVSLKSDENFLWLNEINSQSLQVASHHLHEAYQRFFKHLSGYPSFKKRHHTHQSFSVPQNVELSDNKVYIPKFKKEGITVIVHRALPVNAIIKQATISRHSGKYFISMLIEDYQEIASLCAPQNSIGIDMGLSCYIATSEHEKRDNPKWFVKSQKRLKTLQRVLSRKQKYSKNRIKAKQKVSALHTKVSNQRKDFQHKLSHAITKHYDVIGVESLHAKGMVKNRHLSKAISDASWGEFIRQLEYKALWRGKHLVKIDKWFPSSKACSCCGSVKKSLKLSQRTYVCDECNMKLDRDINASINIKNEALRILDMAGIAMTVKSAPISILVQASEIAKGTNTNNRLVCMSQSKLPLYRL